MPTPPCSISISSISGATSSNGLTYDITINGTATSCDRVRVTVGCGGNNAQNTHIVLVSNNDQWSTTVQTKCSCGVPITAIASCETNLQCQASFTDIIPCDDDACCPPITTNIVLGDCNPDGTRTVTFNSFFTLPHACKNATLYWEFGDGSPNSSPVTFNDGVITCPPISHNYQCGPEQSYDAILHLSHSNGTCPNQLLHFNVPCCNNDCCPQLDLQYDFGKCVNGLRSGTITYNVIPIPNCLTVNGILTLTGQTIPINNSSLTGQVQATLSPGSYAAVLTLTSPTPCLPINRNFIIEQCDCPIVEFQHVVKGLPLCNSDKTREVIIKATVSPVSGQITTATLSDSATGTVMSSATSSTPFTLSPSSPFFYTEGSHEVVVSFAAPFNNCPPKTYEFCVPECETSVCFGLRKMFITALTVFITISLMSAIVAFGIYLDAYLTSSNLWYLFGRDFDYLINQPTPLLTSLQTVALTVAIALFIWWVLCVKILGIQIGSCCASWCKLLLILWQVPMLVGIMLLWFFPCSWLLFIVSALVLFLLSYLFFSWWKSACCPGKCDAKFHISTTFLLLVPLIALFSFGTIDSTCINAPNVLSYYHISHNATGDWFISLLHILSTILRTIIGITSGAYLVSLGLCLSERD